MGIFSSIKSFLGLGGTEVNAVSTSSSVTSALSGNAVAQSKNYILYAESLLEYTMRASKEYRVSFDKVVKNEYRIPVLRALIKRYHDFVITSYLGTIRKMRNHGGLTGLRMYKSLPSEVVEQNFFNIQMAKLGSLLDIEKNVDLKEISSIVKDGLNRIDSNCEKLVSECLHMRHNEDLLGEAKRVQDIGVMIKVKLAKHTRDLIALEKDFERVTALNVLSKSMRLESAMTVTSRAYQEYEASLRTAKSTQNSVLKIIEFCEQSNKNLASWVVNFSRVRNGLQRTLATSGKYTPDSIADFSNFASRFISECKVRDEKLSSMLDNLTVKQLIARQRAA